MGKNSKGQRKLEDSTGRLIPAVEGHNLQCNRTAVGVVHVSVGMVIAIGGGPNWCRIDYSHRISFKLE